MRPPLRVTWLEPHPDAKRIVDAPANLEHIGIVQAYLKATETLREGVLISPTSIVVLDLETGALKVKALTDVHVRLASYRPEVTGDEWFDVGAAR